MFDIAGTNSRPDIIHEHLANALGPMLLMQQILAKNRGGNFRHMFVLGDGGDLRFRQSAQADTIFKGNHSKMIPLPLGGALRQINPLRQIKAAHIPVPILLFTGGGHVSIRASGHNVVRRHPAAPDWRFSPGSVGQGASVRGSAGSAEQVVD